MSTRADHLVFARRRDYPFRCAPQLFSEEQYVLVCRWGYWYEALTDGTLEPITKAQDVFVEAALGKEPPVEHHASAWWRYLRRLAIETKYHASMHRAAHYQEEGFYTRAMVKEMRRITNGTNWTEHRR
ncbi:MAG: DUF413 domain-containing protein [Flavobacteriales bacterium]|nr:DUF413 domain-containing protein [Flavobacteriales bacterium]